MRDVALNPQRSSHNTQAVAVKGLRVWAGKYAVPVLLDILSKESLARVHGEALHELAELRDPSAIEPLAKYLANNEPVFVLGVLDCLAAHGPAAEPAILDNFPTNIDVVSHAVDILGSIGTQASLTKFEAIKKDETYRELWSKVEYFTRKLRERQ
jgi:HEAT repeat protein